MPTNRSDRPRLPTTHRALIAHLMKGGLIQQDESGLAWVSATRSSGWFAPAAVARVRERGFRHQRKHYLVVESAHAGKLMATLDLEEQAQRETRARLREERAHAPRRPRRSAREHTGRLT